MGVIALIRKEFKASFHCPEHLAKLSAMLPTRGQEGGKLVHDRAKSLRLVRQGGRCSRTIENIARTVEPTGSTT